MPSITYLYSPDQSVYVIKSVSCSSSSAPATLSVVPGVVVRVRMSALSTGTTILYDVRLDKTYGTTEFKETDIFATLPDAMVEYQMRIQGV